MSNDELPRWASAKPAHRCHEGQLKRAASARAGPSVSRAQKVPRSRTPLLRGADLHAGDLPLRAALAPITTSVASPIHRPLQYSASCRASEPHRSGCGGVRQLVELAATRRHSETPVRGSFQRHSPAVPRRDAMDLGPLATASDAYSARRHSCPPCPGCGVCTTRRV